MKTPITFRGSFAPIMSAIKIGPEITRLTIDVPKSEQLNAVGLQALLESPLLFTVIADTSPASTRVERPDDKPKKVKGQWGEFWRAMFRAGFDNYPDLIEVLDCAGPQIKLRLYDVFSVTSMSQVSPAQFEDWCASEGLHSLITLSRQAQSQLKVA